MKLDRRQLMTTAAAGAALLAIPAAPRPASAQQPAAGQGGGPQPQPASAYRYRIGDITVTACADGFAARPLDETFIPNAEFGDVQKALDTAFMPTDTLPIPFTPLVVQTGSEVILIDTGFADNGPPTTGQLRANMEAAGIRPEDVTKVVISHFHGDHINGVRSKAGDLVYPNAEIMVPEPEWAFWMDDAKMESAPEGLKGNFQAVRRVFGDNASDITQYRWDQEVAAGVTAVDAHGHTPGHTAFVIASGDDRMIMIVDVTNHPALFVRNPDWSPVFDMDAEQARQTRRRILDMAASEKLRVAGYHFPFPANGYIVKAGDGYDLVPAMWMPAT